MSRPELDVAVVGAGVAGLATAHALTRAGRRVQVFEAAGSVGGRTATVRRDGYLIDSGAGLIAGQGHPATWRLIRRLGLPPEEVPRVTRALALWRRGRAHPHLGRPLGLLTGAGLSARGRLDLARLTASAGRGDSGFDPDQPQRTPLGTATVAELAGRYGPDLGAYVLGPLVGGLFGWDPERTCAGPALAALGAAGSTTGWRTFRDGMDTMARELAARLEVSTGHAVREVAADGDAARVVTDAGALTARTVVLAVPAPVALALHGTAPQEHLPYLRACGYAPMLRLSCLLDRPLAPRGGAACAVLVPEVEDPVVAAVTVDHHRHPGRAPAGRGLVSVLTRGPVTGELLGATDGEVTALLLECGERYLPGLRREAWASVLHRFPAGLPEATPAALRLREAFLARSVSPVEYAGDWLMLRPAVEGALRSAELAAARVLARVGHPTVPTP